MAATADFKIVCASRQSYNFALSGGGSTGTIKIMEINESANLELLPDGATPGSGTTMTHIGDGVYQVNNVSYGLYDVYDTDNSVYLYQSVPFASDDQSIGDLEDVTISGSDVHFDGTVNIQAETFESEETVTAPLIINSTAVVSNLNSDKVDGADVGTTNGSIPLLGATSTTISTTILGKTVGTGDNNIPQLTTSAASGKLDTSYLATVLGGTTSGDGVDIDSTQNVSNKGLDVSSVYFDSAGSGFKIYLSNVSLSSGDATVNIPDGGGTVLMAASNQEVSNKTVFDTTNYYANTTVPAKRFQFDCSSISGTKIYTMPNSSGEVALIDAGQTYTDVVLDMGTAGNSILVDDQILLKDLSGNEVLSIDVGTTPVNYVELKSATPSGTAPRLSSKGTDLNIDFEIAAKGTGNPVFFSGTGLGVELDASGCLSRRTITMPDADVDLSSIGTFRWANTYIDFLSYVDYDGDPLSKTSTPAITYAGATTPYIMPSLKWAYTETGKGNGVYSHIPISTNFDDSALQFALLAWHDGISTVSSDMIISVYTTTFDGSTGWLTGEQTVSFTVGDANPDKYVTSLSVPIPGNIAGRILTIGLYLDSVSAGTINTYVAGGILKYKETNDGAGSGGSTP